MKRIWKRILAAALSAVLICPASLAVLPAREAAAEETILDNIKKFSLATDNFGQAVIVKGYQSEGHDSAHPDYGNIGERQGGEEDFKVLLEESEKYNTKIGVHINHTESYPESKYYGQVASTVAGWSWYDDAKQIIRENDILNEESGMAARLDELKEKAPGLDWVYVDVYGDGRWPAHKLSQKLLENGWAIGSEYSSDEKSEDAAGRKPGNVLRLFFKILYSREFPEYRRNE